MDFLELQNLADSANDMVKARKQAEDALRESEERFATIFNTQLNGIVIIDPETHTIVDANIAALRMIGATREDVIGHICHKFICPAEKGMCPITDLGIDVDNRERVLTRTDHTELSILKSVSRLKLGSKDFLVESFIDITERKQAEAVLREQENKLSSIFRAAPVGIGMVINRVFREANDTLCRMTGYSREELLGRDARMLYPTQEDYDYVGQEKYRQIGENRIGTVETRWKKKDGKVIDIILSSTPLDPNDLALGVTFTALDITDRKQAGESLRESEEKFRSIVETTVEWIWEMDLNGRHTFSNRSVTDILGYRPEELVGQTAVTLLHDEDRAEVEATIPRLIAEKRGWRGWTYGGVIKMAVIASSKAMPSLSLVQMGNFGGFVGRIGTSPNVNRLMKKS